MIGYGLAVGFVLVAYLIGAIPFAYLVVYGRMRVDIRTVGSGNVGATNAGRLLGFRYFVLVFLLDLAKGYAPTLGFPLLIHKATGQTLHGLPVFIALAAILGHNFPAYLRFRGGKGVATSLGALFALDPVASAFTFASFLIFLVVTRYVSLASLMAGVFFLAAHFARVKDPWSRRELIMSLATIGLLAMMIVRHRKNLRRIVAGTEPKVSFRKKKPPSAAVVLIGVALALLGSGTVVAYYATRPFALDCGELVLEASSPVRTGHQRADRVAFADDGRLLAVTCPRYNRAVVYRVGAGPSLTVVRDILLEGRPVDVRSGRDCVYILQRPCNDARHFEEAWWQRFDFQGAPLGDKFRVGFDPDDMVILDDARTALVLLSGRAEGETHRPDPSLRVIDIRDPARPRVRGEVFFNRPGDDPYRVAYHRGSHKAAVSLLGSNSIASVDLSDLNAPRIAGRTTLPESTIPGWVGFDDTGRVLAVENQTGSLWSLSSGDTAPRKLSFASAVREVAASEQSGGWIFATNPKDSGLEVLATGPSRSCGQLPLRGPANLGKVLPMSLAESHGVIAVADRSGCVHLIAIHRKHERAPN